MNKRTIAQRIYFTLICLGGLSFVGLASMLWIDHRDNEAMKNIEHRHQEVSITAEKIRLDMLQMSDALRGLLLNPKSELERQRKLGADDALVKHADEIKALLADQPALLAGINAVAEFDEKTLNRLENEVMDMIPKDAKAASDFYQNSYLPQRLEQGRLLDDFLAQTEKFSQQTVVQQNRSHYLGLAMVGGLLIFGVWLARFQARTIQKVLQQNIGQLQSASAQVNEAAASITATSQSLAQGSGEQAASLEESSASLEELTSMTKRNSENAQKANDIAKQMRGSADHGAGNVQTMSAAMQDIQQSSDDIAKIIKTIDEIAFQTNILALNAAVEAARAGEAGMGFAVVADEVRNLAQRSAQAAKETANKIEGAIANTARGVQISSTVAQTLADIVDKARQMDELVAEVAGASREQSQGIEQINAAVGQMDHVTQGNAASAQECAASAMQLNSQSQTMRQTVNELLQLVGGNAGGQSMEKIAPAHKPSISKSTLAPSKNGHHKNGHSKSAPLSVSGNGRGTIPLEDGFKNF